MRGYSHDSFCPLRIIETYSSKQKKEDFYPKHLKILDVYLPFDMADLCIKWSEREPLISCRFHERADGQ